MVPEGRRSNLLSGFEDWLPTFAELADSKVDVSHDGESLVPTLRGREQTRRTPLYREFPGYGHQQAVWEGPWKAIRTGMLKQVQKSGAPETELYHLETDPAEATNLAGLHPEMVRELEAKMRSARESHPDFPLAGVDEDSVPPAKQ